MLEERIKEVDKALAPKPLPTIPLPFPLVDYTWLSVGRTITRLHKYLEDKKISQFSFIDLSKCMSQCQEESTILVENNPPAAKPETVTEVKAISSDVIAVSSEKEVGMDVVEEKDNVEGTAAVETCSIPAVPNSDGDSDAKMDVDVPGSEDNEEVSVFFLLWYFFLIGFSYIFQATECENEEPTEIDNEQKNEKNKSSRSTKRRTRDLLSDLQIWGWHSKRKGNKKGGKCSEKDLTVENAFLRIIPPHLL